MAGNRVPHRLEDSMRRRISRTTPAGERVVTVAASLARQFTLSQIAAMARLPIADLIDPVREVIDAGIFTETGGRLAFQHDLAPEAARGALPDAARRALARDAADVLMAGGALPAGAAAEVGARPDTCARRAA